MNAGKIKSLEAISKMECHCEESCFLGRRNNLSLRIKIASPILRLRSGSSRNDNDRKILRKSIVNFVLIATVLFLHIAVGQTHSNFELEKNAFVHRQTRVSSLASNWFDVTYYKLELDITAPPNYLKGIVTAAGKCLQNNSQVLTLDLTNTMRVDSVLVDGAKNTFVQKSSSFEITLNRAYQSGEMLSVIIYYQGTPIISGLGSFSFADHNGVPWIYSLSEPYGARDWWPCKDSPSDKADSADIIVTCDSIYKVGSQGILVSVVNNGSGRATHHWKERYPIASYLISIAVTNYVQFSNWFRYSPTDSMEVLNYVLPEHYTDALQSLPKVIDMLSIFSDAFGLYPFINEKYGHAEFTGGGGMEHQTMTSLGTFNEDVVAHELAHQWFGDMITCRSWSDLWLNEGFAEYSTGIYREKKQGAASYWEYMTPILQNATFAVGMTGLPDTTNPGKLFNFSLIYAKGASVLHMLRHVLGDSVFFQAIRSYANDPKLKYSTAVTADFQSICETVSQKDLDYFFQEWIYGENAPTYQYSWNWNDAGDSSSLSIQLKQPAGRANPVFFTMPLDFRIKSAERDTVVTLFNNALEQTFTIKFRTKPLFVQLDPDNWVLKKVISGEDGLPTDYLLEQNYPNPFNSGTTITYLLPQRENVTLKIYDLLGREVTTLVDERQDGGLYEYRWTSQYVSSGVYFYRLIAGDVQIQKKMVVIR
ncbi:MAG: M1 family aminopeptidase [Bacteroidota bacterium]|nr:M1 family aminopeptidase [Bacteroidota bacterium]